MNQSILFNDDVSFEAGWLCFSAMCNGQLIRCEIPTVLPKQQALTHFSQYQFDYEMQAEALIEAEEFNEQGNVRLRFL
ncbi:DUF1488 family protein [Pseudoalteromonas sp. T1lg65]|uniref:DUF1488 family protein n=1 Tax=Pseudoalteromonas sp. T1lg65 TaxID=2077101 RepID=UPI003F78C84C